MYLNEVMSNKALSVFSEKELLYQTINHNRMLDIINSEASHVIRCEMSENYYGEFLYIEILQGNYWFKTHSMGFHHSRDCYICDYWNIDDFDELKNVHENINKTYLVKDDVLDIIRNEKTVCDDLSSKHRQSDMGYIFSELADVGDEDGVSSLLEDLYY